MTEYVYVRPAAGGRVRMPDREFRPMDAVGATVPRIDFYERLILSGDVIVCDPPAAEPAVQDLAAAAGAYRPSTPEEIEVTEAAFKAQAEPSPRARK